ncbi:Endo-1,4-beta-xylanase, GH35 family [Hyunsoonleella jejuensis]|uniref:endo-1,4-beta-xylanase n=1 Tax=Hyunsoonleella jejuensis TaxID=419940 RepID=A0A1H9DMY2_9FLAO|nr:endo-1,4-beta-xylanase [Hyunsoonleella jejuensis]SEQ14068.1 Endo-1,4-beta-xylanase, GH35 family [Hyunsoonleella jejuensis]
MKRLIFQLIVCILSFSAFAQSSTINGEDLILGDKLKHLSTNKNYGKVTATTDTIANTPIIEFETFVQPKFIYNCATALPIKNGNYKAGTVFLVSFDARTVKSSLETGEAKVNVLFRQTDSYKDNLVTTQSISSNWQTYYLPFEANVPLKEEAFKLVFHYGFKPQSFQIKNLKFEVFPKGTSINSLPKTKITYSGMEPDAPWRASAIKRIDSLRKGNFKIQLVKNNVPVANQAVSIKLKKHAFLFGAAVNAKDIVEDQTYYSNFKKAFNLAVPANDLKIKTWRWEVKRPTTMEALQMLNKDNIKVKGHVLIWPGFNYLTPIFKEKEDDPKAITKLTEDHVETMLEVTKGKVSHWDVVNEAYTNQDLQTITGSEDILYNGFRALKAKQPNVLAFTNEYGIISKGGLDTQKQHWYYDFVKRIDENTEGLIDGIGIQCHIGSDLTPPEKVIEILDFYGQLDKEISISEFTMDIQDPEIREQYTKDFMIATLSHPKVREFLFWGFVEDERKKVDVYNKDWSLGAMGKAFFSLVHDQWNTNLVGNSNERGVIDGTGFYGEYEYAFLDGNKLIKGTFSVKPNQTNFKKIEL